MSEFMKVVTVQEALQLMASSLPERDLETISVLHAWTGSWPLRLQPGTHTIIYPLNR